MFINKYYSISTRKVSETFRIFDMEYSRESVILYFISKHQYSSDLKRFLWKPVTESGVKPIAIRSVSSIDVCPDFNICSRI